jgi:hypothetical protein
MKKNGTAAYGAVFHVIFDSAGNIKLDIDPLAAIWAVYVDQIKIAHDTSSQYSDN